MEQLNNNLISGVVADTPEQPDETADREATAGDTCAAGNASTDDGAHDADDAMQRYVDKALDKFADQLRMAEECGFRRAIEQVKAERLSLDDRTNSCPNFLSDLRPDFWQTT